MLRRDLFQFGFAATIALLTAGAQALCADDGIAWGAQANSLKIGVRIEARDGLSKLVVLIKNVGSTPRDLYLWESLYEIQRIDVTAKGIDGRQYKLEDRRIYLPCGGLCIFPPKLERVEPGATIKVPLALDLLVYYPPKGPYPTLAELLEKGYSVRAAFEVTEQQLKDAQLSPELPWLGRAVSGEVGKP